MDEKLLISLGLSQNQARTYRALIMRKSLRPSQLSKLTGESRTNSYALLDRLVELGLATKSDENKKFVYYPVSPSALKALLSKQLTDTEEKLAKLDRAMPQMLSDYHAGGDQPKVTFYRGKKELETMYTAQMEESGRELYFVRSKADVPYFSLETMKNLRHLAPKYGKRRFGITPIVYYTPSYPQTDAQAGGLKRAWLRSDEYTAKVEWAVSGNTVQAICMDGEGYGVSITHPEIADSFKQLLELMFTYIRKSPGYEAMPDLAKHGHVKPRKSS